MVTDELLNTGLFVSGAGAPDRSAPGQTDARTIIISGIARSGTSMVAGVLREAGLFLGDPIYEVVHEDAQLLEILRSRQIDFLKMLVGTRNAQHACWGFKIPNLHAHLRHDELSLFRNPHLVMIYRDPVAVAVRNSLSEQFAPLPGLVKAANAMHSLAQFICKADCPTLLLSYEKALQFPQQFVDSLLAFCGIPVSPEQHGRLLEQVRPNDERYLVSARRIFEGHIDGIMDDTVLFGWCREFGRLTPVLLDLLVDDTLITTFNADVHRSDLRELKVGNGDHGFAVDLSAWQIGPDSTIRVRINEREHELDNSGRTLASLRAQSA